MILHFGSERMLLRKFLVANRAWITMSNTDYSDSDSDSDINSDSDKKRYCLSSLS